MIGITLYRDKQDLNTFMNDRLQKTLDSLYEYKGDLALRFQHRERIDAILKRKKFITPPILDAGCGRGAFIVTMGKEMPIVGVDIDHKALVRLKETIKKEKIQSAELIIADLTHLPFIDKTFGTVICSEVLEHIDDTEKGYFELIRVLKRNGYAIISMPNILSLYWILRYVRGARDNHVRFPATKVYKMIGKNLEIVDITSTYHGLPITKKIRPLNQQNVLTAIHRLNVHLGTTFLQYQGAFFIIIGRKIDSKKTKQTHLKHFHSARG